MKDKYLVYIDDPIIDDNNFSSGMSRVNGRLLKAIEDKVERIIISEQHCIIDENKIIKDIDAKVVFLKNVPYVRSIAKKITKSFELLNISFDLLFFIDVIKNMRNLNGKNKEVILFAPLGADIRSFRRVYLMSKILKIKLYVYIVDEFKSSADLANDKFGYKHCEKKLNNYLEYCDRVYTISQGMSAFIKDQYGIKSVVLNLPYEYKKPPILHRNKNKRQIMFLGNTSHFYIDGLTAILRIIKNYNEINEEKVYLRLTKNNIPKQFESYIEHIVLGQIDSSEELHREISSSLFSYIPYSFKNKYEVMVNTSFPSKTLECMNFSRNVLIFAPANSSSTQYFIDNQLSHCISVDSYYDLEQKVLYLVDAELDNSDIYRRTLKNNHGYDYVAKML